MAYKNKKDQLKAWRRWYQQNKGKARKQRKKITARNVSFVKRVKEMFPCTDCGCYYPAVVMDFDHVRGEKKYTIAAMVRGQFSLSRIQEEIRKCELVCSNCHRLRTHNRR